MFGYMNVCVGIAIVGVRKAGKFGLKKGLKIFLAYSWTASIATNRTH